MINFQRKFFANHLGVQLNSTLLCFSEISHRSVNSKNPVTNFFHEIRVKVWRDDM